MERRLSVSLSDWFDLIYDSDPFFSRFCFFLSYSGGFEKYSSCFLNYFISLSSKSSNSESNFYFYLSKSSLIIKFNLGTLISSSSLGIFNLVCSSLLLVTLYKLYAANSSAFLKLLESYAIIPVKSVLKYPLSLELLCCEEFLEWLGFRLFILDLEESFLINIYAPVYLLIKLLTISIYKL